ncbi:hypothetical protein EV424DRAFT_1619016 [Suillus variegatus]|nr:hypothetical protein EV424DRAFT_1619016 [Suillus variegatus]
MDRKIVTVVVDELSNEEVYSYGLHDFEMHIESLGNSQSPAQPSDTIREKCSISQEITPYSHRVDARLQRRVSRDQEMHEIAEVSSKPAIESDCDPRLSHDLDVVRWIHGPEACTRLIAASLTNGYMRSLTVNSPQVEKSRKSSSLEFGIELDIVDISHCQKAQPVLDRHEVAWGTIFELAQGVTRGMWTFQDMTEHRLRKLKGKNAQSAWKVATVMADKEPSVMEAPSELWLEYDREQLAIVDNKGHGLGTMGQWEGKDYWYGGKIQQVSRVVKAGTSFNLELEKLEIRRSHTFSRFLGFQRILKARVPDRVTYDKVGSFLAKFFISRKFILCGRVFVPFHSKEGNVCHFQTNQNIDRQTNLGEGYSHRLTLYQFLNRHNHLRCTLKGIPTIQ